MRVIRSIKEMSEGARRAKAKGLKIGFVPTMGSLHQGHLSLVRRARRENGFTVVSIFVNPAQFGPGEDFKRYPRNSRRDIALCRREGVDVVFCPGVKEIYPRGCRTLVAVKGLSGRLCGKSRPGHFDGVATIVTKLFNIVGPDVAYFGQKDAQQAVIIKRLVCDLNFAVKIKVMPIVRQKDGLALSSRNSYLSPEERKDARILSAALKMAGDLIRQGNRNSGRIIRAVSRLIRTKKKARIDYVSIVDLQNLKPVKKIKDKCLLALAVWLGRTRLIDNRIVSSKRAF